MNVHTEYTAHQSILLLTTPPSIASCSSVDVVISADTRTRSNHRSYRRHCQTTQLICIPRNWQNTISNISCPKTVDNSALLIGSTTVAKLLIPHLNYIGKHSCIYIYIYSRIDIYYTYNNIRTLRWLCYRRRRRCNVHTRPCQLKSTEKRRKA